MFNGIFIWLFVPVIAMNVVTAKTAFTVPSCGDNELHPSVCDPNNMLQPGQAVKLNKVIREIYNTSYCRCHRCYDYRNKEREGFVIKVLLMGEPLAKYGIAGKKSAKAYASFLLESSFFNKPICSNTALIVVSKYTSTIITATGQIAEERIPADCADKISKNVSLAISDGQYYDGVSRMIAMYRALWEGEHPICPDTSKFMWIPIVIGLIIVIIVLKLCKSKR